MRKKITLALLSLLLVPLGMMAQNVTISGDNGSMLASRKSGGTTDAFFGGGGFATWKHKQLNLTLTTADSDAGMLTENGQLENPANDIFVNSDHELILAKGTPVGMDTYVCIALPKGYTFTGYTILFSRNVNKAGTLEANGGAGSATFGETDANFEYTNEPGTIQEDLTYSSSASQKKLERNVDNMGNVLYFKIKNSESGRVFLTLHKVELKFSAEGDYVVAEPTQAVLNRSAVDIPFATSKVDYGRIEEKTYGGMAARMSYSSASIEDLEAYLTLYEEESTTTGTAFDGTSGKVVNYTTGTITSQNNEYFKVGKSDNSEQRYYIETPTYVTLPDADKTKSPIGYRIVGATLEFSGQQVGQQTMYEEVDGTPVNYNTFYISGTAGNTTYYLDTEANATTKQADRALWFIDGNGFIRTGDNGRIYLGLEQVRVSNYSYDYTWRFFITTKESEAYHFSLSSTNNRINANNVSDRLYLNRWNYSDGTIYRFEFYNSNTYGITSYNASYTTSGSTRITPKVQNPVNIPAYAGGAFTVVEYDQQHKYGHEVTGTDHAVASGGTYTMTLNNLNNDAIKFGIKGVGLVKATLTLQALDPYLNRLDIVCQEAEEKTGGGYQPATTGKKLSIPFTADDFSVKGGKFNFYVPASFSFPCMFTFEDMYSNYGDNTYWDGTGTGNARYSLVMSDYWTNNDVSGGQPIMNVYDTDPDANYERKVKTELVGNQEFVFNNASEFTDEGDGGIYKEFVFNPGIYGEENFEQFVFSQAEMTVGTEKTAYLFTCDETRYNIAPTNAIQHTYYAYYQMDITMKKKTYEPVFDWKEVYDATCYNDGTSTAVINKKQYGLELTTTEAGQGDEEYGYLTVWQVKKAIQDACKPNNTVGAPESPEQILYIDGSKLLSIVEDQQTDDEGAVVLDDDDKPVEMTLDKLKEGLGANALIYLPEGTTSEYSNIAYKEQSGGFFGANDFELIDMRPFYAPYDIQISPTKTITYKRTITVPQNGKVTSATIIMPFEISLENAPFTLHKMQAKDCLEDGGTGADPEIYFPDLSTSETKAEANKPYLVKVTNPGNDKQYSFILTQAGTKIIATTSMESSGDYKYTFQGETGSGTASDGTKYTFVNHGSYAGKQLVKTGNYFYFSKDMFLRSNDYKYDAPIKIAPFRTYYSSTASKANAKLAAFDIIFGEGEGNETDGISNLTRRADLMVTSGKGTITMASTIDQSVRVNSLNGMLINNVSLQSGEMHTINVPSGIYVVNGVKIIVK